MIIKLYEKSILFVLSLSLLVFIILFFIAKPSVEAIAYVIILSVILFLEINVINYFYKKELLFFRMFIKYEANKIGVRFERFLCLIMSIAVILLLFSFVFFSKFYSKLCLLLNSKNNPIGGGFRIVMTVCVIGALIFWLHYFLIKMMTRK